MRGVTIELVHYVLGRGPCQASASACALSAERLPTIIPDARTSARSNKRRAPKRSLTSGPPAEGIASRSRDYFRPRSKTRPPAGGQDSNVLYRCSDNCRSRRSQPRGHYGEHHRNLAYRLLQHRPPPPQ
jgi:hypothetical protein